MKTVFRYAGTQSLSQEMKTISKDQIQAGDLFIKGGFPGHAVIVIDVAENAKTKEKIFLLAQSYMPAQEIHILKNFSNPSMSPWYSSDFTEELNTPEWTFYGQCLKRFP
jgi:hypothetical protein